MAVYQVHNLLRYIKDWVQSINVTRRMRRNNYVVYGESQWRCEVGCELTSTVCLSG